MTWYLIIFRQKWSHDDKFIYFIYIDGTTLVESMAILQYLEDTRPEPSLQPSTPLERARMREICEVSSSLTFRNWGKVFF